MRRRGPARQRRHLGRWRDDRLCRLLGQGVPAPRSGRLLFFRLVWAPAVPFLRAGARRGGGGARREAVSAIEGLGPIERAGRGFIRISVLLCRL